MPNDTIDKGRLKNLITRRSSVKGQITKFKNYLNGIANMTELNSIQLTELSLKLAKFEALSVRVDDLQNEIEVLNAENISTEIDERDNVERDIIINIATAKTLLNKFIKKTEGEQRRISILDNSYCSDQEIGLKLPQIQIAKFDGAYFRWLEFRDTFENLIHNNMRMSPIHKFHYLISYLEGDAARIISNLEVSSTNYTEAWKLLCSRYNNKRILINHHLSCLFNIKPLPRESERSLRFLVDHITKNLRALTSLGQPTDKWDVLIIFMITSKLDSNTLTKWEEYRNNLDGDAPTLEQFYKFIIDRADVLEALNRNKYDTITPRPQVGNTRNAIIHTNNNNKSGGAYTKSFLNSNSKSIKTNVNSCIICNDNHKIYDCPVFKAKGVDERLKDVTKYKLCINCLRQGHPTSECHMGPCRECKKRHNSLLHRANFSVNNHIIVGECSHSTVNLSIQNSTQVILSTALIKVSNPLTHKYKNVRALLDCGSQSSFISKSLQECLALKTNPIDSLKVIGIGNNVSNNVVESCKIQIVSLKSKFNIQLSCLVLNELTGYLPKYPININNLNLSKDIALADPTFNQPGPIDVLIGADLFWDILGNKQLSLGPNNPKLRNTQLGWIISGPVNLKIPKGNTFCNVASASKVTEDNIDASLRKFWELEEIPPRKVVSEKDKVCETHFVDNTRRDNNGRFCVKLPLIDSPDCLGDTSKLAKRRLINLEKRFKRNPQLKSDYTNFINEYAELGHLSLVSDEPLTSYYLCHHAVQNQDSESTKLRVVFDGSATSSSGYSLNDLLMVGPNLQDSLFTILIRARQYKFLLTGDIEKMYRQVLVHEEDRDLQRILWRENESQPVKAYRLNTLTYGTASASFLSTRCLWQIGEEHHDDVIKNVIQKDFYVDDLITGADNERQLKYIQSSVAKALSNGCFNLRKYKSNNPDIFNDLLVNKNDKLTISESSSTLGLGWIPVNDTFYFPIKNFSPGQDDTVTKRFIMSNSFKLFDPLGLLSPIVIQPKIILQKLWQQKLDWDQPVSRELKDDWLKFANNLQLLSNFQIPRLVLCDLPARIELHSFSDASQIAYGACIYVKSTDAKGKSIVKLLCAKSKVSPLKPTSIPRLELCAALLAARLCKSVVDCLRYKPDRLVHWCDSSVVIGWINSDLTKLKTFVGNRTTEILELTKPSSWRYVPTKSNPADLISRGVNSQHLMSMELWWSGPNFLINNESEWPVLKVDKSIQLPEIKVHAATINESILDFNKYSSLHKLQGLFAFVQRFIFNVRNSKNRRTGILTVDELRDSFHSLCLISQRDSFPVEYELLKEGKVLKNKSKILSLSPFMDKDNLIRVGGRIDASTYAYEKRHPILLHATHRLTKLYFEREHINGLHAGPQLLLAIVREVVWPISGKHLARRTVNNCVRCRRLRGQTLYPKMGGLPPQRINPGFPFLSVGVDFAGPFFIINRKGRGSRLIKCYLCLFVCLRYKCIHLEAVSDLTKEAFIMTLRRFISRRGKPTEIFCDNGRNFVAAAKELGNFIKDNKGPFFDFASQEGIKFNFIPTYAPHFGGIWEAGVKSAKYHLRRVIGNSHLTFEEILTLFAQVEAILNSRPLCPLSSCPNDLLSLTPGHFIIGRPLTALPVPAPENCSEDLHNRYERLGMIRQHFWQRWQKEYLSELQQRTKWRSNSATLNIGDMVLLAEDNAPPMSWRLGRVLKLYPGADGISRVADIDTIRGCVRRPFTRLCKLPTAEDLKS